MSSVRNLSPEIVALIIQKVVRPAVFLYADFPTGAVRVWTGPYDYQEDSETLWQGVGGIISLDSFSETTDSGSQGIRVRVDGLNEEMLTKLRETSYQGREAYALLAFLNVETQELVFCDEPLWKGTIDKDESSRGKDEIVLAIYFEHRLADVLRKREWRYTDRDQQELYPPETGEEPDTFLDKMELIQDLSVPWGRTQV